MATHALESPAAPSYQPSGAAGNERITVNPTPDAFGASVARAGMGFGHALGEAGASAFRVADFYSQVTSDDAYNQLQDFGTKLIHGDPNGTAVGSDGNPVMGPDGKPMPDTGFMGTRGADTLRTWQDTQKKFDDKIAAIRGSLQTDQQRHNFDVNSRRLRSMMQSQIGAHADQQMKVYGQNTNEAAARNAITAIGLNPDNPEIVEQNTEALRHTYTKQVQLAGGGDEAMKDAIARANRDALAARVQMIGVDDPARAQKILDENKEIAGPAYVQMSEHLRHRNDMAVGEAAAQKALGTARTTAAKGAPSPPVFVQASQSVPGAMSPHGMMRLTQIEFGGGKNDPNNPGHQGPVQASTGYWARFGAGGDRNNWNDSLAALARSTAADRKTLTTVLGRDPTDGELYLAHQQGPGGASALLRNPDMNAVDALSQAYGGDKAKARAAIVANGGDPAGTAAAFANKWIGKFGGGGGVPEFAPGGGAMHMLPESVSGSGPTGDQPQTAPAPTLDTGAIAHANVQAAAYAQIMADPSLTPTQRQMALSRINHEVQAEAIRDAATTKAKKEVDDAAANEYVSGMLAGKTVDLDKIANDPRLQPHTKVWLSQVAEKHGGSDVSRMAHEGGPGFWDAYKEVTAPEMIGRPRPTVSDLLQRVGPGGKLTLKGVHDLTAVMKEMQNDPEKSAQHSALQSVIAGFKTKMSFNEEMMAGGMKLRDPNGEMAFHGKFVPRVMQEFSAAQAKGEGWKYISDMKHFQDMADQVRPKGQMQQDRLAATAEGFGGTADAPTPTPGGKGAAAVPPAPKGVDAGKWTRVVAAPPPGPDGKPFKMGVWSAAVQALLAKPTPANIAAFNKSPFGKGSMDAAALIKELSGQ